MRKLTDIEVMSRLIIMGGSNRESITPDDLRMVITYSNQLRQIEDMLSAHAESIISRLSNGAEVEPGVHTADIREFQSGTVKHQVLAIDGVERYRRVSGGFRQLARTAGA